MPPLFFCCRGLQIDCQAVCSILGVALRRIGWISLVYLKEPYRGAGLGIQPLGRAITDYQKLGRRAVRLHVSSDNTHAVGFDEHYGFKIIGKEPGAGAPLYLMEKVFE